MSSFRFRKIRDVDRFKIDRISFPVWRYRFEPRLVSGRTVVSRTQLSAIQMVNGRHVRDATGDQIFNDSAAISGQIISGVHLPFPSRTDPFKCSVPVAGEGFDRAESAV